MLTIFSQRHADSLSNKKIQVSLATKLRHRIIHCMRNHDHWYGWNQEDSTLGDDLKQKLLEHYGQALRGYVNDELQEVNDIETFIKTAWPALVFDAIELYNALLAEKVQKNDFPRNINQVFKTENSPYRLLEGHIVILDSAFLESAVLNRAGELLKNNAFEQASRDFLNARNNFTSTDYNGTVFECNNAVESALKKLLDNKNASQNDLKKGLMKAGLIPDYFQGFCENFEGLLQSLFSITNNSVRHGKRDVPDARAEVDKAVASFVLHLTGTLLVFIMERYEESREPELEENVVDDDLPF